MRRASGLAKMRPLSAAGCGLAAGAAGVGAAGFAGAGAKGGDA
jgi:hypothetical protein